MNKRLAEAMFTLVVLIIDLLAVKEALVWGNKTRLFPLAIGIPLAVLLTILLVKLIRDGLVAGQTVEVAHALTADAKAERRRTYSIVGWILGFLVGIWAIGFPLGGTLGTVAFLRISGKERWPISLAIAGGTAAFFWMMATYLHTPFPRGELFELLLPAA